MLQIEKCKNGYVVYGDKGERHSPINYEKVYVFETSKAMYEHLEERIGFKEEPK